METINPGEFRHKISIVLFQQSGKDSAGFDLESAEVTVCEPYARITDESGTTALKNGSEFSVSRRRFLIRMPSQAITADMFVRQKNALYKIDRPPCTYGDSGRYMEIWGVKEERV